MFVNLIIVKTFTSLFFNKNRKSFKTYLLIKYIFSSIILKTIKIIKTIVCYCIKKYKYKIYILINFEKQYIKNTFFTLLTINIRILTRY